MSGEGGVLCVFGGVFPWKFCFSSFEKNMAVEESLIRPDLNSYYYDAKHSTTMLSA